MLFCKLTESQKVTYLDYLNSRETQEMIDTKKRLFAGISVLRAICNHPSLYSGEVCVFVSSSCLLRLFPQDEDDWRLSSKLLVLEQLLPMWQAQGHRALLFSQTRMMLDIVERMANELGAASVMQATVLTVLLCV